MYSIKSYHCTPPCHSLSCNHTVGNWPNHSSRSISTIHIKLTLSFNFGTIPRNDSYTSSNPTNGTKRFSISFVCLKIKQTQVANTSSLSGVGQLGSRRNIPILSTVSMTPSHCNHVSFCSAYFTLSIVYSTLRPTIDIKIPRHFRRGIPLAFQLMLQSPRRLFVLPKPLALIRLNYVCLVGSVISCH